MQDAREARALGFVSGITTNPTLLAREERRPLDQLWLLLEESTGAVFYQPVATMAEEAEEEALRAHGLAPGRVTIKLPARVDLVSVGARLVSSGVPCALTAVYSPAQALAAAAAGFSWLIPYVDRAHRLLPDGDSLVARLALLRPAVPAMPSILAASVKSPVQAVAAFTAGAAAATMPLEVLTALAQHDLSDEAIAEFGAVGLDK